jgi:hypothetical protein
MVNLDFEVVRERIYNTLEELLGAIMDENDVRTGDIAPEQSLAWDDLIENMAELVVMLVEQNSGMEEEE